jgi:hypothetical protein
MSSLAGLADRQAYDDAGGTDYLIDALALHENLHVLRDTFADPNIIKVGLQEMVFHGLRMLPMPLQHSDVWEGSLLVKDWAGATGIIRCWVLPSSSCKKGSML